MKKILTLVFAMLALPVFGATPSYQNFDTGSFRSNNFNLYLGPNITNQWLLDITAAVAAATNALTRTNDTRNQFWSGTVNVSNNFQASSISFISNNIPAVAVDTNGAGIGATASLNTAYHNSDKDFVVRLVAGVAAAANLPLFSVTYGAPMTDVNLPMSFVVTRTNNAVGAGAIFSHVDGSTATTAGFKFSTGTTLTSLALSTNDFHFVIIGK